MDFHYSICIFYTPFLQHDFCGLHRVHHKYENLVHVDTKMPKDTDEAKKKLEAAKETLKKKEEEHKIAENDNVRAWSSYKDPVKDAKHKKAYFEFVRAKSSKNLLH